MPQPNPPGDNKRTRNAPADPEPTHSASKSRKPRVAEDDPPAERRPRRPAKDDPDSPEEGRGKSHLPLILAALGVAAFLGLFACGGAGWMIWRGTRDRDKITEARQDDDAQPGPNTTVPRNPPVDPPVIYKGPFPRRLLFVSVSKYMYLNPLTATRDGIDLSKSAAQRMAYDWRVPTEKGNDQLFILSDTLPGADARLPTKSVIQGAYEEFFKTSRAQDRIVIYFGGHAIEKDGKAYIAPAEADVDGEDWEASLIPLADFYGELRKCKAAQKVVIWDVCRFNPEKGRVRPGSEPMTDGLHKALSSPPAGIQTVVTCKPGENALEFTSLRPDGFAGAAISGSAFLDAMKFVADSKNGRLPKSTLGAADPLPLDVWMTAADKRVGEIAQIAKTDGYEGKQTVKMFGSPPGSLPAPNAEEKAAARFEMPQPPKGVPAGDITAVEREFALPPIKPGLVVVNLTDFPFAADAMKPYAGDGVSLDTIRKNKGKYPFRAAVLDAIDKIRSKWAPGAGTNSLRDVIKGPFNDAFKARVKKEQQFWAIGIIELEGELDKLKAVADKRAAEPKRWQAHYDFTLAALKGRLAYMNEYDKLMGLIITETLPALDTKLGQDGYLLVASDTLKSGKEIKKLAEESQALFQEIALKYKGTPWAVLARQEQSVVLGLKWQPASTKKE